MSLPPKAKIYLVLGGELGWATIAPDFSFKNGSLILEPKKPEGLGLKFLRLTDFLNRKNEEIGGFDTVYYAPYKRGANIEDSFDDYITAWCKQRKIRCVSAPTIKARPGLQVKILARNLIKMMEGI